MKKIVVVLAVVAAMLVAVSVSAKESRIGRYLEGTVVGVDKRGSQEPVLGQNPSDAPLADPATFAYDVAVNVNCGTYVGRYQSWYDYVPSGFAADRKIQLRLTRSMMYVSIPDEKEIELAIVSKHIDRRPCNNAKR